MEKAILKQYINTKVGVGVENFLDPAKLFFYFGILEQVTDSYIILETDTGHKQINLDDVLEIRDDS